MKGLGVKITLLQASRFTLWLPLNVLWGSLSGISFRDYFRFSTTLLVLNLHSSEPHYTLTQKALLCILQRKLKPDKSKLFQDVFSVKPSQCYRTKGQQDP